MNEENVPMVPEEVIMSKIYLIRGNLHFHHCHSHGKLAIEIGFGNSILDIFLSYLS